YVFEKTTVANTPDKQIVSQDPTAGSFVQSGTSITLYYNESQKTEMIKVTGYTLDKAKEMLDEAGIKYKVVEEGTKDYAVGTIFKQGVNEGVGINVATQTVTITVATEYHGLTSTAPPPAA
ncbi:MAG: PASTA domain-containing protein, partial [Oscillospiraceae bacterium]